MILGSGMLLLAIALFAGLFCTSLFLRVRKLPGAEVPGHAVTVESDCWLAGWNLLSFCLQGQMEQRGKWE